MHQFSVRKVFEESIVIMVVDCNFVNTVAFFEHIDLFAQIDEETVTSNALYFQILSELFLHIIDAFSFTHLTVASRKIYGEAPQSE